MSAKIKMAIACDHAGFDFKRALKAKFESRVDWLDLGTHSDASVDYPDFGQALARAVSNGDVERGVLICGSGIGISIAANRYPAVRAALCTDATMARLARLHNDANVLVLGARIIGVEVACDCTRLFLDTAFEGGRHEGRVRKLSVNC